MQKGRRRGGLGESLYISTNVTVCLLLDLSQGLASSCNGRGEIRLCITHVLAVAEAQAQLKVQPQQAIKGVKPCNVQGLVWHCGLLSQEAGRLQQGCTGQGHLWQ